MKPLSRAAVAAMSVLFPAAFPAAGVVKVIEGFTVTYPAGKIGGSSSQGLPAQYVAIPPAKEYYLDFQVRFHADWEWVKGGKLSGGLVGGKHTSGCAGIVPDGWSARFTFGGSGSAHIYLYDQNRKSGCGDTYVLTGSRMPKEAWNRLTQHVVVNTPGRRDGLIEAWLDGRKLVTISNVALRGNVGESVALIDNVSLQTFYGGSSSSWAPSRTTHATYSDFYLRSDLPDFSLSFEAANSVAILNPSPASLRAPGPARVFDLAGRLLPETPPGSYLVSRSREALRVFSLRP